MKQFYLLILAVLTFTASFSQTSNQFDISYGYWSTGIGWSQNHAPANGEVVVVPANTKVLIISDLSLSDAHLRIYGTVTLVGITTTIDLDSKSDIVVYDGGKIEKTNSNEKVRIDGFNVFPGLPGFLAGPLTATASTAGFQAFLLPVKFVGFSVAHTSNGILVQWSTSEEHNASSFEVERSLDGSTWTSITSLKAAGNSSALTNYSFTDRTNTNKVAYYRIKQVDNDGKFVYTAVKSIRTDDKTAEVKIASVSSKVVLQFPQQIRNGVSVRIVSLAGNVIQEQRVEQAVGQVILSTTIKGNYIVSVSNGRDLNIARQVLL